MKIFIAAGIYVLLIVILIVLLMRPCAVEKFVDLKLPAFMDEDRLDKPITDVEKEEMVNSFLPIIAIAYKDTWTTPDPKNQEEVFKSKLGQNGLKFNMFIRGLSDYNSAIVGTYFGKSWKEALNSDGLKNAVKRNLEYYILNPGSVYGRTNAGPSVVRMPLVEMNMFAKGLENARIRLNSSEMTDTIKMNMPSVAAPIVVPAATVPVVTPVVRPAVVPTTTPVTITRVVSAACPVVSCPVQTINTATTPTEQVMQLRKFMKCRNVASFTNPKEVLSKVRTNLNCQ